MTHSGFLVTGQDEIEGLACCLAAALSETDRRQGQGAKTGKLTDYCRETETATAPCLSHRPCNHTCFNMCVRAEEIKNRNPLN